MSRFRDFKNRKRKHSEITSLTLTPLIDTALNLLVIFMITAPIVQNGIKVDLPFGKSKEAASQQELVVTLSKDNKIYFNSYPTNKDTLVDSIKKALVQKDDLPVYIKADESIAYGKVIEIVDQLKCAGVKYVAMSTRPHS